MPKNLKDNATFEGLGKYTATVINRGRGNVAVNLVPRQLSRGQPAPQTDNNVLFGDLNIAPQTVGNKLSHTYADDNTPPPEREEESPDTDSEDEEINTYRIPEYHAHELRKSLVEDIPDDAARERINNEINQRIDQDVQSETDAATDLLGDRYPSEFFDPPVNFDKKSDIYKFWADLVSRGEAMNMINAIKEARKAKQQKK